MGVKSLDAFSDSQLVVNQVQEDYFVKDLWMVTYLNEVKTMSINIKDFKICQILIEENKKADALANLASTFDFILNMSIPLEYLPSPSIEIVKIIYQVATDQMWMDDTVTYLQDETLPLDKL